MSDTETDREDAELCRRCGEAPGRERWYVPGEPGRVGFSLAGQQAKVSAKRTVGCDPCWDAFLESRGVPVRSCCGARHTGPGCPDGLVLCALCFTRVLPAELHELDDGSREDVCKTCAEQEEYQQARAVARVRSATLRRPWRDLLPRKSAQRFSSEEAVVPAAVQSGSRFWPAGSLDWRSALGAARELPRAAWGTLRTWRWLEVALGCAVWNVGLLLVLVGGGHDGTLSGFGLTVVGVGWGVALRSWFAVPLGRARRWREGGRAR